MGHSKAFPILLLLSALTTTTSIVSAGANSNHLSADDFNHNPFQDHIRRFSAPSDLSAELTAAGHQNRVRSRRQLGGQPLEETISVTAQIFAGRLFDYGLEHGDKQLGQGLDIDKKLTLTKSVGFFGRNYSNIYISSNGGIGFDHMIKTYRSNIFPGPVKLIAPFWNRNDLRNGGTVFYREVTSGRVLERGQSEIRYQYERDVRVHSAVVVTYEKMQPVGAEPLPEENTNTFQVALFITESGTFVNFIYSNIGWTQGAEAGFSNGNNIDGYTLPTSGTGNIMFLEENGNTGIPGEWMFLLEQTKVVRCKAGVKGDTCDETCPTGEWGPDCGGCCHCAGDVQCDATTGACPRGQCSDCWTGPFCREKKDHCKTGKARKKCAQNAIALSGPDRCGEPSTRCECLTGFHGDGYIQCSDIDECSIPGTCHEKATCTNTPGRFFCRCMDGYSGDGVSECVASILYPYEGGQKLPEGTRGRIEWQLKQPLMIFGRERDHLTVKRNGLIVVEETSTQSNSGSIERLEDIGVIGFTPYHTGETFKGEVRIKESNDYAILSRASKLVNEQLGEPSFTSTSALIFTYLNVSTKPDQKNQNTFQMILIGGKSKFDESQTYTVFFYLPNLVWVESAEAGILTADKANSILLPGSGTPGIEQLGQLSNVKSPGIWLYRIDGQEVFSCIQKELQPPYCDFQSSVSGNRRPQQHRPSHQNPSKMTTQKVEPMTTTELTTSTTTTTATTALVERTLPSFKPQRIEPVSKRPSSSGKATPGFARVETKPWSPNSDANEDEDGGHSGSSKIEEITLVGQPNREAAATIPPRNTKPSSSSAGSDGGGKGSSSLTVGRGRAMEIPVDPRGGEQQETDSAEEELTTNVENPSKQPIAAVIVPDVIKVGNTQQKTSAPRQRTTTTAILITTTTELATTTESQVVAEDENGKESAKPNVDFFDETPDVDSFATPSADGNKGEIVEVGQPVETIVPRKISPLFRPQPTHTSPAPPARVSGGRHQSKQPSPVESFITSAPLHVEVIRPSQITKAPSVSPKKDSDNEGGEASEDAFSTEKTTTPERSTTTTTTSTTTSKTITTTTTSLPVKQKITKPPKIVHPDGADEEPVEDPESIYDSTRVFGADFQENKLPVILVVAIVALWLFVLIGVSIFVCCRRRKTRGQLRLMYGPAYQIRPVSAGFTLTKQEKHIYEGQYDMDHSHLNKLAHLSASSIHASELNSYYPCGRNNPGGRHWNLSPDGARSSGGESSDSKQERCSGSLAEAATTTASAFFNNHSGNSSNGSPIGRGLDRIGGSGALGMAEPHFGGGRSRIVERAI